MEPEFIKIKCPYCGAVLTIKNMLGLDTKSIPCPVCKKTSKFTEYKTPKQQTSPSDEDNTTPNGDVTKVRELKHRCIGRLQKPGTSELYKLTLGLNTIGRKAQSFNATVQIDTDDRSVSRIHANIEVCKQKTGDYYHYFSNAQNKNATYVNSQLIENGDRIVLRGGETIKMANITLKFLLDQEEDMTI